MTGLVGTFLELRDLFYLGLLDLTLFFLFPSTINCGIKNGSQILAGENLPLLIIFFTNK